MRTAKCQLMATSLCIMLLGLSIATLSTVTHYGLHFTVISDISPESNSYRVIHHAAFYIGICLSMTLILAALLSSAATVRESQCLTATVRIPPEGPAESGRRAGTHTFYLLHARRARTSHYTTPCCKGTFFIMRRLA